MCISKLYHKLRPFCCLVLLSCLALYGLAQRGGTRSFQYPDFTGKVMAGYQGWFNTAEDGAGRGWHHYARRGTFKPGSSEIDYWPDMREYKKQYETSFHYKNGEVARVFSAFDPSSVALHFKWMKDYGIDGVFMQRFVAEIRNPSGKRHFDQVLKEAMLSAKKRSRAICIMYDLSGMKPGEEHLLLQDLRELTEQYGLLETSGKTSPTYLHYRGKPLIAVWGVGFNDHRAYGLSEAQTIIDTLKASGFSVMVGVPTRWRQGGGDAVTDGALRSLLKKADLIAPWLVGRYNMQSYPEMRKLLREDLAWCEKNRLGYVPLAFPGFSWKNMNGPQSTDIPRNKGAFFWQQVAGAKALGAKMLYIAMFDEINEGTAIMKVATKDQVPLNGTGDFHGIEPELGSDYYLYLAGEAARWFHGKKGYSEQLPSRKGR